ncbi:MAG: hypothetical protein Q4C76_03530 [Bacillota bacterium]|nr:hypothetical protein [Bacillota bacterium]
MNRNLFIGGNNDHSTTNRTCNAVLRFAAIKGDALIDRQRTRSKINVLQQRHGLTISCGLDGSSEGSITVIPNRRYNVVSKNSFTVNYKLTSRIGHKTSIEITVFRCGFSCLLKGIAGFSGIGDGHFTNIGGADHNANAPAPIVFGVQVAVFHSAASNRLICGRICTSMPDDAPNRTGGSDVTAFNGTVGYSDTGINRTIILNIIASGPANQAADSSPARAGDRGVLQMATVQFNCRHRIYALDKCAKALLLSGIVDIHLFQSQIFDHDSRFSGKAAGEQSIR